MDFSAPVEYLIANFITGHTFFPIVTRDFKPPKPSPAGILHIAKELGLEGGGAGVIVRISINFIDPLLPWILTDRPWGIDGWR